MAAKIVTFLTDFGTRDGYVGSVKGVIKSIAPQTEIIDISHEIPAFDVKAAAFALLNYYSQFPEGTVHLIVVDPGVGSARKPVIAVSEGYFFVAPDNGVLSLVETREELRKYEISLDSGLFQIKGATFHGRDVFGPTAAWLTKGKRPQQFGRAIPPAEGKSKARFFRITADGIECDALAVDRFGNVITGLTLADLQQSGGRLKYISVKGRQIPEINDYYGQKPVGQLMALWNSLGLLEISVNQGNAAERLKFDLNRDKVYIYLKSPLGETSA